MAKVTIRFVYERDYEIPEMSFLQLGDSLVMGGEIIHYEEKPYAGDQEEFETVSVVGNIFDKPLGKMRYVSNLYNFHQENEMENDWIVAEENEE